MEKAEVIKNYQDFKNRLESLEHVLNVSSYPDEIKNLEAKMLEDDF